MTETRVSTGLQKHQQKDNFSTCVIKDTTFLELVSLNSRNNFLYEKLGGRRREK